MPACLTYLNVPFKDKNTAKALGARWDNAARQWYVPEGGDVAIFQTWLALDSTKSESVSLAPLIPESSTLLSTVTPKGIPLSQLLGGVAKAVS